MTADVSCTDIVIEVQPDGSTTATLTAPPEWYTTPGKAPPGDYDLILDGCVTDSDP